MPMITLPWPHVWTHPNARQHWAKVAPLKKKARAIAKREMTAALIKTPLVRRSDEARYRVSLIFYPPARKRKRDLDGMLASMKAQLDGIADAMGIDDSRFDLVLLMRESRDAIVGMDGMVTVVVE